MASIWRCTFSSNVPPHGRLTRLSFRLGEGRGGEGGLLAVCPWKHESRQSLIFLTHTHNKADSVSHVHVFSFWSYKANKSRKSICETLKLNFLTIIQIIPRLSKSVPGPNSRGRGLRTKPYYSA